MKRILCYGDSNTWGHAGLNVRIDDPKQWPNILQAHFLDSFRVVQQGLRARVAGSFETEKPYLNGQDAFEAIFRSSTPVAFAIIALGTNDLKSKYGRTAQNIYDDLLWYADKINDLQSENDGIKTEVIFIAPANFSSKKDYFDADQSIWRELLELLKKSEQTVISFTDLEMGEDGLHYKESAHKRVAEAVYEKIKEQL